MKYLKSILEFVTPVYADVTTRSKAGAGEYENGVLFNANNRTQYGVEVQLQAIPRMRFFQFARVHEELLSQPGTKVQVVKMDALKRGSALSELTRIQKQALKGSTAEITVVEHATAVAVSEFNLQTSFMNTIGLAIEMLSREFAVYLDLLFRDKVCANTQVIYARKSVATLPVVNSSTISNALAGDFVLSTTAVDDAVEILNTNGTPLFDDEYFIGMISPHQARSIKDNGKWEEWSKYTTSELKRQGEIGRWEQVRFVETQHMPQGKNSADVNTYDVALKSTHGDQVPLYKACIFGEDHYAIAVALYPELRDDGVEDFGRTHSIAWYGIFGVDFLNAERGVVIITS